MHHAAFAGGSVLLARKAVVRHGLASFESSSSSYRAISSSSVAQAPMDANCLCRKGKCREGTCRAMLPSPKYLNLPPDTTHKRRLSLSAPSRGYLRSNTHLDSPHFTIFRRNLTISLAVSNRREEPPFRKRMEPLRHKFSGKCIEEQLDTLLTMQSSRPDAIREEDIVNFSRNIASSEEVSRMLQKGEVGAQFIDKVDAVLQELKTRNLGHDKAHRPPLPSACMSILVHLLRGQYSEARVVAAALPHALPFEYNEEHRRWLLLIHSLLLLSSSHYTNPSDAFSFFVDNLQPDNRHDWDEHRIGKIAYSLDTALEFVLKSLSLPASVLTDKKASWSTSRRSIAAFILTTALLRSRRTEDALLVAQEAHTQQLQVPASVQERLVRALARAKMFDQANIIFDALPVPNDEKAKHAREALGLYLFSHQGNVIEAENCFERLKKLGQVDAKAVTLLMHASAVHGDVDRVLEHFNTYYGEDPTSCSEHLGKPTIHHYGAILNALAEKGDLVGLNDWLARLTSEGIAPDRSMFNTILKAFAFRGDLPSMRDVLSQMKKAGFKPDQVSYTTVIKVLARKGDAVAAETMYKHMVEEGFVPDAMAITTLMNAHAEAGSWNGVIRVFDYLRTSVHKALVYRVEIFNTLLKAYVLIGSPFEVVSGLFRRYEATAVRPNKHTFALLIQSACDNDRLNTASRLFVEMEEVSKDWTRNIDLSPHVFSIIIAAFLRRGKKAEALEFYNDMQARGIQPTSYTFASILKAYAISTDDGSLQSAEDLLKSLVDSPTEGRSWREPNSGREGWLAFLYAPLLKAYVERADMTKIEEQYSKYVELEEEPSIGILTLLLDAYRTTDNAEAAQSVWPQIVERAITRTREVDELLSASNVEAHPALRTLRRTDMMCIPLSIYIDAMSRTGNHVEIARAWNFLRGAGFQCDAHNWNHLVVALVRAGKPSRAFEIVEKVIVPYERQARSIVRPRSDSSSSPYLFDDETSIAQLGSEPFGRQVGRPVNQREEFVRQLRKQQLRVISEGDDFARELHLLQQISPAWSVWRPHEMTLRVLANVLHVLDSGKLIYPMPGKNQEVGAKSEAQTNFGASESKARIHGDPTRSEEREAKALLNQILIDYPQSIARVDRWERGISTRGSRY